MSPAAQPLTPWRSDCNSSARRRNSPKVADNKVVQGPGSRTNSPTKQQLEVGLNGFYFSCELPKSKITPKKTLIYRKATATGALESEHMPASKSLSQSPRSTVQLSPMRMSRAEVQSSNFTLVQREDKHASQMKVTEGAKRMALGWTPNSTKISAKTESKTVPDPDQIIPSAFATPIQHIRVKPSQPEDMGHLIASLGHESVKTHDWAHKQDSTEQAVSPAPTPLRRASEKLRMSASPSFVRLGHGVRNEEGHQEENVDCVDQLPTPPQYGEAKKMVSSLTSDESISMRDASQVAVMNMCKCNGARPSILSNQHIKDPAMSKHVRWSAASGDRPRFSPKRTGTDPSVLLEIQKEMIVMGAAIRRPFNVSSESPHDSDLRDKPNTTTQRGRSQGTEATIVQSFDENMAEREAGTTSNNTSRTAIVSNTHKELKSHKTASGTKQLVSLRTSNSSRTDGVSCAKITTVSRTPVIQHSVHAAPRKMKLTATTTHIAHQQRTRLAKPVYGKPLKLNTLETRPTVPQKIVRGKSQTNISRSARKSIFDVPASSLSTRGKKPVRPFKGPSAASETSNHLKSKSSKHHDLAKEITQHVQPYASALEIANTIATWHVQDPVRDTTSTAKSSSQSTTTPEGSPPRNFDLTSPCMRRSKTPTPGATARVLPTQRLKTPGPARLKFARAVVPPTSRIAVIDRNALRTPSKEIQESLDKAIDEKIREDSKRSM
ncbi:hypothetical protein ACN47E_004300 [Coniothyrium glycines]